MRIETILVILGFKIAVQLRDASSLNQLTAGLTSACNRLAGQNGLRKASVKS
jgi:hypothetical protein